MRAYKLGKEGLCRIHYAERHSDLVAARQYCTSPSKGTKFDSRRWYYASLLLVAKLTFKSKVSGDLLEILEMHIGVLLEHFAEIDQQYVNSPVVVEAASSIIYAGGQPDSKGASGLLPVLPGLTFRFRTSSRP